MGVVFLAEDAASAKVAIKLIRSELADDPDFRARFHREVEAARRVGGLCTAKYLDADLNGPRPYLVTQYVEGGNLAEAVAAEGPMAEERLIGLAVGLAEAVVAMHAAGVVHRDLKPSNVLLAPDGPKVVDFGISQAAEGTALTQPVRIVYGECSVGRWPDPPTRVCVERPGRGPKSPASSSCFPQVPGTKVTSLGMSVMANGGESESRTSTTLFWPRTREEFYHRRVVALERVREWVLLHVAAPTGGLAEHVCVFPCDLVAPRQVAGAHT